MSDTFPAGGVTLRRRALTWAAVIVVLLVALIGLFVYTNVRTLMVDQLADGLEREADAVSLSIGSGAVSQDTIEELAGALNARITIISLDGSVTADSEAEPRNMDDHGDRPEVIEALAGSPGRSRRLSATTGEVRLYVALPPRNGQIVRLSVTEGDIADELRDLSLRIAAVIGAVTMIVLGGVSLAMRRFVRPISELTDIASSVASGRLDIGARRSRISELDRLGLAIEAMATDLGHRISEAEVERHTLSVILGSLPNGVILIDVDDRISYFNEAAELILGAVPDRLNKLAPASIQRLVRRAVDEPHLGSMSFEVGSPTRFVTATATSVGDDRVLVLLVDQTDQHRVESIRRDFVADASHELKTPVATILASMETLRMAIDRDVTKAIEFADQVEASARRLSRIVEDLLDLSRLESSDSHDELVSLDATVKDEVERLRHLAVEAGVELEFTSEATTVRGSERDLGLAVRNLCENALRYTDDGGRVSVNVRVRAAAAEVEVSDSGRGIPTRALDRVFERFFRVDMARSRDTGGTGLGLAIVKHVAERHGGSVTVTSQLGAGSKFVLSLPVHDVDQKRTTR